jgi:predicted transglutaminase-like cysteine proteinase
MDKLRLIYVKAKLDSSPPVPHMVLAYYAQLDAEPLILDNLIPELLSASKRSDLTPVFSFNSKGIFAGIASAAKAIAGGTGRLSRWENLLNRARLEGFE